MDKERERREISTPSLEATGSTTSAKRGDEEAPWEGSGFWVSVSRFCSGFCSGVWFWGSGSGGFVLCASAQLAHYVKQETGRIWGGGTAKDIRVLSRV